MKSMKLKLLYQHLFSNSLTLLDLNPISLPFYLLLILFEFLLKSAYGLVYLYVSSDHGSVFGWLRDLNGGIGWVVIGVTGYLGVVTVLLMGLLATKEAKISSIVKTMVSKVLMAAMVMNHTALQIPILVVLFQALNQGITTDFALKIQSYHLCLAVLALTLQCLLYAFNENFLFCFYPSHHHIPWSKPSSRPNYVRLLLDSSFSLLLVFAHHDSTTQYTLLCVTALLQLAATAMHFWTVPFYSRWLDDSLVVMDFCLAYIYAMAVLKYFL